MCSVFPSCLKHGSNECYSFSGLGVSSASKRNEEEESARVRRAAEREGRRTRRRRARELKGGTVPHYEGMSSDDEQTELEVTAFKKQKGWFLFFSMYMLEVTHVLKHK